MKLQLEARSYHRVLRPRDLEAILNARADLTALHCAGGNTLCACLRMATDDVEMCLDYERRGQSLPDDHECSVMAEFLREFLLCCTEQAAGDDGKLTAFLFHTAFPEPIYLPDLPEGEVFVVVLTSWSVLDPTNLHQARQKVTASSSRLQALGQGKFRAVSSSNKVFPTFFCLLIFESRGKDRLLPVLHKIYVYTSSKSCVYSNFVQS